MTSGEAVETIVRVMGPYIGETMARSAAEAHCQKLGLTGDRVTAEQLDALLGKLGAGLNIFVGRERSAEVMSDVRRALADGRASG
jgi:hypothetical protein